VHASEPCLRGDRGHCGGGRRRTRPGRRPRSRGHASGVRAASAPRARRASSWRRWRRRARRSWPSSCTRRPAGPGRRRPPSRARAPRARPPTLQSTCRRRCRRRRCARAAAALPRAPCAPVLRARLPPPGLVRAVLACRAGAPSLPCGRGGRGAVLAWQVDRPCGQSGPAARQKAWCELGSVEVTAGHVTPSTFGGRCTGWRTRPAWPQPWPRRRPRTRSAWMWSGGRGARAAGSRPPPSCRRAAGRHPPRPSLPR